MPTWLKNYGQSFNQNQTGVELVNLVFFSVSLKKNLVMKLLLILIFSFCSFFSVAQISGDISVDGRKIVQEIAFTMEMKGTGAMVFDIAVDVQGNVTSCVLNKAESTIRSTVYSYQAKNLILTKLKFEKGNGFPTFHRGQVTISALTSN